MSKVIIEKEEIKEEIEKNEILEEKKVENEEKKVNEELENLRKFKKEIEQERERNKEKEIELEEEKKYSSIDEEKIKEEFDNFRKKSNEENKELRLKNKGLMEKVEKLQTERDQILDKLLNDLSDEDKRLIKSQNDFDTALMLAERFRKQVADRSQGASFGDGRPQNEFIPKTISDLASQSVNYRPRNIINTRR